MFFHAFSLRKTENCIREHIHLSPGPFYDLGLMVKGEQKLHTFAWIITVANGLLNLQLNLQIDNVKFANGLLNF